MNRIVVAALLLIAFRANADELSEAKPVPRMQVTPEPYGQATVTRDGEPFTKYHFGETLQRPFLYPLIGPSGRSVTRMGHPRDPNGHSHHNSIWVSHHDVNGVDFWGDRGKRMGRIVHRRVLRYDDFADEAIIEVANAWVDETGKTILDEQRRMRFFPLENRQWMLQLDLELRLPKNVTAPVTLGKTPFGLVGVRMAKTIGVHDGGGRILNSAGDRNEEGVFWKPAKWVDYSGPITPNAREGVTLFDHPSNPNHPTTFHVRNDGWMGASLTFAAPREITASEPLKVRYGVWVHSDVPDVSTIEKQFSAFNQIAEPVPLPTKSK